MDLLVRGGGKAVEGESTASETGLGGREPLGRLHFNFWEPVDEIAQGQMRERKIPGRSTAH